MPATPTTAPLRLPRRLAILLAAGLLAAGGCRTPRGGASPENGPVAPSPQGPQNPAAPRPGDAAVTQARDLLDQGREDDALRVLARAIERNPTLTVAHLEMGDIYRERGDYNAAERSYDSAARLEPRNFDAQYLHGLTLHLLNRLDEAVRAYLRALAIRSEDQDANLNLAIAYLQLNEPNQAVGFAEQAARLNPDRGEAQANLGAVYSALGRHADAVRRYERAAELMTLNPQLLVNWAESLGRLDRYTEMVNTLERAIALKPSAPAHERLGFAHFRLRQFDLAKQHFRKAIDLDATHFPALNGLGVCRLNDYLVGGQADRQAIDDAMDHLRASLRINQNQPRIVELVQLYGRN
ncbi:MAG: tetratricopeptide repeat protein [Phycisphaerales bacterium]|nr:tetratricopeptide repeat protein [Phycisphaerales bacterium]